MGLTAITNNLLELGILNVERRKILLTIIMIIKIMLHITARKRPKGMLTRV